MYVLDADVEKCTGCRLCMIACSFKHTQVCNPVAARIQIVSLPEVGLDIPLVCRQCEDAPCARICPTRALARDSQTGAIAVDYEKCIGCRYCLLACPFGSISVDPNTRRIEKCNLCNGDPACIKFCEPGALRYVPVETSTFGRRMELGRKLRDTLAAR